MIVMKLIFLTTLICTTTLCCHLSGSGNIAKRNPAEGIKGYRIYREFPVIDTTGKVEKYLSYETRLYFLENKRLLQTVYYHADMKSLEELRNPGYKPVYYSLVYSIKNKIGLLGDSNDVHSFRKVPVDSVLKKEWIYIPDNFGYLKNDIRSSPLGVQEMDGNTMSFTFSFVGLKDTAMKGIYTLFFSKDESLRNFEYSFSPHFDSMYKMKLTGVVTEYYPRYFPNEKYLLGNVRIPYFMEEIAINNREELRRLFMLTEGKL